MFNQNVVFNGLGTFSLTVDTAGVYTVEGQLSLPSLVTGGGASSVVVTVNKNGSGKYTGLAGAHGFKVDLLCAADDVIAIVLTSSADADNVLTVKSNFQITGGV